MSFWNGFLLVLGFVVWFLVGLFCSLPEDNSFPPHNQSTKLKIVKVIVSFRFRRCVTKVETNNGNENLAILLCE
jgi:hypothetical protein